MAAKNQSRVTRRRFLQGVGAAAAAPYIIPASALGGEGRPAPSDRITMGFVGVGGQGTGDMGGFMGFPEVQVAGRLRRRRPAPGAGQAARRETATPRRRPAARTRAATTTTTTANSAPGRTSTPSSAPRPTTGTRWSPARRCATARTCTARSRKRSRSAKGGSWSRRPAATAACSPAAASAVWEDYNWYHRMMWSGTVRRAAGGLGQHRRPVRRDAPAGRARARVDGLGPVARPGPVAALQQGLSPVQLARLPRLLRRRHDRLGRPPHRRRAVRRPVVRQAAAGGGHPAGRQGVPAPDLQVRQRRADVPGRRLGRRRWRSKARSARSRTATRPRDRAAGHHHSQLQGRGGIFGDFLHCVKTRERPFRDIEIAHRTVATCHLANIAFWTGRAFKFDPVKEEIVGDEEANRWIDRPKREPWVL